MFGLMPWTKRTTAPLPRTDTPFRWLPEFENLFSRFVTWPALEMTEWPYRWGLTMEEKEKEVVVRVELPGFTPEEIKIEMLGDRLMVEAEHKEPVEKKEKEEAKAEEREYAHVKRELTLPLEVELEKAEASYRNGVLEVHLPRKPEAMGRRIEVKT